VRPGVHCAPRLHAVGQPAGAGLWITPPRIPANTALAYALIYGEFGLPRLEMFGAGSHHVAISAVHRLRLAAMPAAIQKYRVLGHFGGRIGRCSAVCSWSARRFAAPCCWNTACSPRCPADGLARHVALAAHQIRSPWPRSCSWAVRGSMAATTRVGHAVGRRDSEATRRAGMAAIVLGAGSWPP